MIHQRSRLETRSYRFWKLALLPEMDFCNAELDVTVECLRHTAGQALASMQYPVPGGISITLLASPAERMRLVNLKVEVGDSLSDALHYLAQENGFRVLIGTVGILLCPESLGAPLHEYVTAPAPLAAASLGFYPLLGRNDWLRL